MDTGPNINITAAVFEAYLHCPTKAYLTARCARPPGTFFAALHDSILTAYKIAANQAPGAESATAVDFAELRDHLERPVGLLFVDCEAVFYTYGRPECGKAAPRIKEAAQVKECVPILYSPPGKREPSDDLRICFGALAIAQLTGADVPRNGKIIWGEEFRIKTVTIADHLSRARQVIEAAASLCRTAEPPIVLNKHCPICDFQPRCRALAIERDSLSLITGMTQKERAKCKEKGISTITQLSYGYRPRRRKRVKVGAPRVNPIIKHDHKLKALAIKKTQIHVVGSPSLSMDGTPVFMDVEGMPDRDFYYLVGLRYDLYGKQVERSFWANEPEGECDMWHQCLLALQEIDNPRIVHYGAYEKRFLRRMMERWKTTAEEADFINRIGDGSINLLASIYGKIYFPTYSNSLKEIGRWLGFEWSWPQASGQAATLLRRLWELSPGDTLRDRLIRYNMEDCRAIALIGGTIAQICDRDSGHKWTVVNTSELEVGFQRTFGKFPSALPDFEKINAAAYWDYQQSKVYVRANKVGRRRTERTTKPLNAIVVEKEINIEEGPESCPKCGASKLWVLQTLRSRVVFDIKFTRKGIKRWSVRYRYKRYRCSKCRAEMVTLLGYLKYGYNLRAYVIYLLIELRLSHQKIAEHVETVFKIPILRSMANNIKFEMAKRYESTYREILRQISCGPLVHVDETKGVVYGGGHYVWIFANLTSVAYVYSPSREASILHEVLGEFGGVLVSDFYGAYDSVSCRQQRCLIHLMRDINDDVIKHPFNEELAFVAKRFGILLREIVETIDKYGLKRRHLAKHKRAAQQFLDDVAALQCTTEVCSSLKKRIEKNQDKLFTFLDHDNVPWNNNNAEHAVRAFTRLRNLMASSTAKGTREYCILLTVQQTLKCRDVGFLDFLRSGRTEIDGWHRSRSQPR